MEVGIPSTASTTLPDLSLFYTLLYQGGSDVYDDEAKKTIIDNEAGVNAFATYTSFFNDYGMPTEYDFVSRFRSGQMPIGIANYISSFCTGNSRIMGFYTDSGDRGDRRNRSCHEEPLRIFHRNLQHDD